MSRPDADMAARFIVAQLAMGSKPDQVAGALRSRWPSLTTGELVKANAIALTQRRNTAAAEAAAITRLVRASKPPSFDR